MRLESKATRRLNWPCRPPAGRPALSSGPPPPITNPAVGKQGLVLITARPRALGCLLGGSCQRDRRPDPQYPNPFPAFWKHLAGRRPGGADDLGIVGPFVKLIFDRAALPRNAEASVNLSKSVPVHWPALRPHHPWCGRPGERSRGAAIPRHASRTALEKRGEECTTHWPAAGCFPRIGRVDCLRFVALDFAAP
jgi:hypothetical protein